MTHMDPASEQHSPGQDHAHLVSRSLFGLQVCLTRLAGPPCGILTDVLAFKNEPRHDATVYVWLTWGPVIANLPEFLVDRSDLDYVKFAQAFRDLMSSSSSRPDHDCPHRDVLRAITLDDLPHPFFGNMVNFLADSLDYANPGGLAPSRPMDDSNPVFNFILHGVQHMLKIQPHLSVLSFCTICILQEHSNKVFDTDSELHCAQLLHALVKLYVSECNLHRAAERWSPMPWSTQSLQESLSPSHSIGDSTCYATIETIRD